MASPGETTLSLPYRPKLQKQLWEKNLQFRTFYLLVFPASWEEMTSIPFLGDARPRGAGLPQHSMRTPVAGGRIQAEVAGPQRWKWQWGERCFSLLPVRPKLKGREDSWKDLRSNAPTMQSDPGNTDGDTRGMCQGTSEARRTKAHQVYRAGP